MEVLVRDWRGSKAHAVGFNDDLVKKLGSLVVYIYHNYVVIEELPRNASDPIASTYIYPDGPVQRFSR